MPVYNALPGYLEAVASIGVDERGIVEARLALYACLAHRVAFGLVDADYHRPLLEMEVYARLEEQCASPVHARLQGQRPAARGGDSVYFALDGQCGGNQKRHRHFKGPFVLIITDFPASSVFISTPGM